MKWWHKWRARVWENRYIMACGKLRCLEEAFGPDYLIKESYYDIIANKHTAASACRYHRDKAGLVL